ncbi:MAG: hypothetical protein HXS54_08890 [Theionarchaea archaeon]|nr:hypothetical protein [Theionarchaea archaeon]
MLLFFYSIPSPVLCLNVLITNKGNTSDYPTEVTAGQYFTVTVRWYQDFDSEITFVIVTGCFSADIESGSLPAGSHYKTFEFWAPPIGEKSCDIKVRLIACATYNSEGDCEQGASDEYKWTLRIIEDPCMKDRLR